MLALVQATVGVLPIAACFAVMAAYLPVGVVRARARRRRARLRDLWPDVVDNITSGVRAGLALPEALSQLGTRGPGGAARAVPGASPTTTGSPGGSTTRLDRLKERLSDPVGDRLVESLRIAREVGGTDLGHLLRTLSAFLREDARTRAELETRQSLDRQRRPARGGRAVGGARHALDQPRVGGGLLHRDRGRACWPSVVP